MNNKPPIRMSMVTNRKLLSSSVPDLKVTREMCNYARNVLNSAVVSELARNVSLTTTDCNKYWKTILELHSMLEKKEGKPNSNVQRIIEYGIIPKLDKQNLGLISDFIKENTVYNSDELLSIIGETLIVERIANNHKSLSKRFDIDKIARMTVNKKDIQSGVYEMCDLIDTYDISTQAKFNIALENITYAMNLAGYKEPIVEEVLDYYLLSNPVIPDTVYETMQNLIKNSRILSQNDKDRVKYFTESNNRLYRDNIDKLAEQCKSSENARIIRKVNKISTEKQAGVYIETVLSMLKEENIVDAEALSTSILTIPLVGNVSKEYVSYKINEILKNDTGIKISPDVQKIVDDDESMLQEANLVVSDEKYQMTIVEAYGVDYSYLFESEDFAESEDVKKILNDFKSEQKKSTGRFKYYLAKIYRKSPESIIDNTPNILATLRIVFILAPSVIVPYAGPVISLVLAFIDKMLSMKINQKQAERLIRMLEAERDKVDKDLEKKSDKKAAELEKYGKCIDQCIKKIDAYRSAITDDEMDNRRVAKKSSSSSNSKKDDDLDFDLDDDFGFDLESVAVSIAAINTILEAKQNNLQKDICRLFNQDISTEDAIDILEASSYCHRSINLDDIAFESRKLKNGKPLLESVKMETAINMVWDRPIENTIDDLVMEAMFIDSFNEVITEGFKLSKLKLMLHAARDKAKDLSTKEKAVWRNIDIYSSNFVRGVEKAMTSDRREAIIKGSIIPSFSKCIKSALVISGISILNPVLGVITAMGMIGVSKSLNHKERQLIYDEIDTELKVVEIQIEMANNNRDMKKYRYLLQYQKRLEREKQRIKYGIKVHGRNTPMQTYDIKKGD